MSEGAILTKSVSQVSQALVSPEEYARLEREKPPQSLPSYSEEDLIVELERLRLAVEAEIQWQDFAAGHLQRLITDSDELVHHVASHYADADRLRQQELEEMTWRLQNYTDVTVNDKILQLQANIDSLTESLAAAGGDTCRLLESIQKDEKNLLDESYKLHLSALVDHLNRSFNAEVSK